jgi:hypothetical protein
MTETRYQRVAREYSALNGGTEMSIASTVAALERANAAHKAAQAVATPAAKRVMFALVEREHQYRYLCGAYAGHVSYTPCIVTRVDRAGIVKEVKLAGQSWPLKGRDWQQITVDSAGKVANQLASARRSLTITAMPSNTATTARHSAPSSLRQACPERPAVNRLRLRLPH